MKKELIENKIYAAIIGECERMEFADIYRGNGHHLAQRLTYQVSKGTLPCKQKQVVDVMSRVPKSTKEIASLCGMESKTVSAILCGLEKETLLVGSKRMGKLKQWYLQIVD